MRRIALLVSLSLALVMACDDDGDGDGTGGSAAPCNEDPAICPSGQTCWFVGDGTSFGFTCLNSGAGMLGEECQAFIGTPTCGDGLMCKMLQGQTIGVCTEWCNPADPNLACPDGRQCEPVGWTPPSGGAVVSGNVCDPPAGAGGSGGDPTGGGGTTSGSGGATGGGGGAGG